MLRKALTFGMVFILALSLLSVSMVTCFTYDADADDQWDWVEIDRVCVDDICVVILKKIARWHTH
ncbi:hypothetical protein F4X33_12630 [Candidatus Poribacteria bacterium]|nr:hypothetical protein [Candidatus Poribacteria bacterium]